MDIKQVCTPIYTIGYGNRSIQEFIEVLERYGIAYLIDVRSVPYSRYKPEFSQATLMKRLMNYGIHYVFMGNKIGGRPDDAECYVNGKVDYEKVNNTENYQHGIQRLIVAFTQGHRVALMCSEGKPENCHRSKLIGVTLTKNNVSTIHIDENDIEQTQETIIERLTNGQLPLFGEEIFHSCKQHR